MTLIWSSETGLVADRIAKIVQDWNADNDGALDAVDAMIAIGDILIDAGHDIGLEQYPTE